MADSLHRIFCIYCIIHKYMRKTGGKNEYL
ncbi:zinc-finger domain-containing protein [Clostridium sp. AM27-31LB]|nr:zinc-finger domain-containing protein [Clostridium sp. AM27-31LB]RHU74867.1 zinc-finger domain-containing protein [Butyribacter intestini]